MTEAVARMCSIKGAFKNFTANTEKKSAPEPLLNKNIGLHNTIL